MPESLVVPRGDTTIVSDRWPGSSPTVVLLHAGVADRRGWYDLVTNLP